MIDEIETIRVDLNKLENLKPNPDGSFQSACPMCRQEGSDKKGNHLRIYQNFAFSCVKYQEDKEHNRGILGLVGTKGLFETSPDIVQPTPVIDTIYPDDCLTKLIKSCEYWYGRGISPATLDQFDGGVAINGKMKNRYVFPMRNAHKSIIGFSGRYVLPITNGYDIDRWKHIGHKKSFFFDRLNCMDYIKQKRIVSFVEGIGCVLALREIGMHGVIPIFGVVPSSMILSTIISLNPSKIIISLNNEKDNTKAKLNGNEASERMSGILSNYFNPKKIFIDLPPKKDWLDCTKSERHDFKLRACA